MSDDVELRLEVQRLHAQLAGIKAYVECLEGENKSLRMRVKEMDKAEQRG